MNRELLAVLDETGESTGAQKTKKQILMAGDWRQVVHAWIVDDRLNLLIQRRAIGRGIFDGLWDVSVGGGVKAGEPPLQAIVREVGEELGVIHASTDFTHLGRWKIPPKVVSVDQVMKDFSDTYLLRYKELEPDNFDRQDSEVSELAIMPLKDFRDKMQDADFAKNWVPHGTAYYQEVVDRILSMVENHA